MPGIARMLSKLGHCSRQAGAELARAGRVRVNGTVRRDPEFPVVAGRDVLSVDGAPVTAAAKVYVMLNKPRGLVTTSSDEKGRDTVFTCLQGLDAGHLGAVGRLDKASEGLLLFSNDSAWAEALTHPDSHVAKTYHVQIDRGADEGLLTALRAGVRIEGEMLRMTRVNLLRAGNRTSWLEVVLEEGRNRHIRRMMEAQQAEVTRLVRVAIGGLELGSLGKGQWRHLSAAEVANLAGTPR